VPPNSVLEQLFSKKTIKQIVDRHESVVFNSFIKHSILEGAVTINQDVFESAYQQLEDQRLNEYVFKNYFVNKILLGKHNTRTTTALSELPIGNAIADLILINGKATVYEIKSPLDNTNRLSQQIAEYFKAFKFVTIVGSEKNIDYIYSKFGNSPVGIWVFNRRHRFSRIKEPEEFTGLINKEIIFKSLRKAEYEEIILDLLGFLPDVGAFKHYSICLDLFKSLDNEKMYSSYIKALKGRNRSQGDLIKNIPSSIRSIVYLMSLNNREISNLKLFLQQPIMR